MGNSDWGSPQWGSPGPAGPAGNPWKQEEPASSRAGGLATGIIVAAVAVVVLVVGLIAAGLWVWNSQGSDGAAGDDPAPAFTAVPEETSESSESSETSETSAPSPSPSRPAPDRTTSPSRPSDAPSDLTSRGWRGVSAATCNASDRWVFAGTNGEDRAVVCRVGEQGDLYYRGYYNNRAAEYDIDMQRVGPGRWVTRTLDNNGSRVEITGSGVRVVDGDGDAVSSRDFTWSSENSGGTGR
ncbi:hypothetical protein [Corynebacterium sp.]|uniref:hypothetical protein n=1 Tax=Corynebacterium sp. TaxID=1720 RepID=UPI0025B82B27|nr:hypothetical protein [Corynebacterium sp.]